MEYITLFAKNKIKLRAIQFCIVWFYEFDRKKVEKRDVVKKKKREKGIEKKSEKRGGCGSVKDKIDHYLKRVK